MRRLRLFASILAISFAVPGAVPQSAEKNLKFEIVRPTVIAYFAPNKKAASIDDEAGEAYEDFQLYANRAEISLEREGIEFHEVYARSFHVGTGAKLVKFSASKSGVGYYLIAPGKKPRIEYGVMTDIDLLSVAHEYFGMSSRR